MSRIVKNNKRAVLLMCCMLVLSLSNCQQMTKGKKLASSPQNDADLEPKTTGGIELGTYDFTAVVKIVYACGRFCAGTLLDQTTIVTAASCLNPCRLAGDNCGSNPVYSIQIGFDAIPKPSFVYRKGEFDVVYQTGFRYCNAENDIALIKLHREVPLHQTGFYHRKTIELPGNTIAHDWDQSLYALGWGGNYKSLQMTTTISASSWECQINLPDMRDIQMCTFFMKEDAGVCNSDAGGPLVRKKFPFESSFDEAYELVGIITNIPYGFNLARDDKCRNGSYFYYTNVATYLSWIRQEMKL